MKNRIRILFYALAIISVIMFLFTLAYVTNLKAKPLAVIEGINGTYFLDNRLMSEPVVLKPGKYFVAGSVVIKTFSKQKKIVEIPFFEVEIVWEK